MALLEVDELAGGYRADLTILHGVSLAVEAGQTVSIIGPNGAGKSTVLRAIFGMLPRKCGSVVFDGRDISDATPMEILRSGIAFSPQGRNLFTEMTVEENLRLGGYVRHDRAGLTADIEAAFDAFPVLREHRGRTAGRLSGGQMQMLEVARAMLVKPRLLLVDEPSLGLAPTMATEVLANIATVAAGGTAVLIVEQNADASLRMSDYAYVIETGTNRVEGPAAQILADPSVRLAYLGG
ncbi:MAG: ABC transporter ATP-binding protein [Streptosporangiales bacterium]